MYRNLEQKDGEWILDPSKIISISELTFNEMGNITKVETRVPEMEDEVETTYFQFENHIKLSYVKVNAAKDTTEKGTYNWLSDFEYELTIYRSEEEQIESWSKLNDNYRDLSGGYKFVLNDSVVFAQSYENTVDKDGRITKIIFMNDLEQEKNAMTMTYGDDDTQGNPRKVILIDDKTGELDNLSVREFTYFE